MRKRSNRFKRVRPARRSLGAGGAMQKRELRLLEGAALLVLAVLIVAIFFISAIQHSLMRRGQAAAVVSAVLVDLANRDRASQSLATLKMNSVLTAAAQAKADDMAGKGYFAHVSPQGRDSWYWFKQAGYAFSYAGENLAVDFSDSADVERAWMQSASHRENLLDSHFTEIGIAIARGMFQGHPTVFVVQMFGSPAKAAAAEPREITTPKNPTEPAIATTLAPSARNVLGESANALPKSKTAPLADIRTPSAGAPVRAIVHYAPAWGFLATSPKTMLRYAYLAIGLLVILALLLTTGLELRWHHRRAFAAALCLLVFMSGLFVVADYAVFSEPVLADASVLGSG